MKEINYIKNQTGTLEWESKGMYYRFQPNNLPFKIEISQELVNQLQKTALLLGRVDGLSQKFTEEEINLLQIPFMIKEATLSSEIEGTRSTITDVYKEEKIEEKDPEKKLDNEEIKNYGEALAFILEKEITTQNLLQTHKILLKGVRGHSKDPGKYKETQNAIGKHTDNLDTAKFVPASPDKVSELMDNLITYINDSREVQLIKLAITHYQFEAIHPFRDGNGRIGRLLIMQQLCKEKILKKPLLYISEYLTRNRDSYTDKLYDVSMKGNLKEWILFFLKALEYQANISFKLINELDNYKKEIQIKTQDLSRSPNMHLIVDKLFQQPFITVNDVKRMLKISQPAARNLLIKLVDEKILLEYKHSGKEKVYFAHKILNLIEGKFNS
jgi:Fic family protein